ncbi:hypothetical protein [Chengkuizengella axinellae]|uniref:DUF2508 family protein n=1 Tax=Chengkuizengella axinellae TaxID=3064388 RepID=A0ABT9IYA2_9BACL|nr:hypothetical protein [Chengkuizengella sp. 2205SS18-9]MDP5274336.1 hypothetical protein [Chengkuizengella sp. 2205SS18-9]
MAKLTKQDDIYIKQMESWLKEQEAYKKQIKTNIETSSEIVRQNKIQLKWANKRIKVAVKEYNEWRVEKGLDEIEYNV